VKFFNNKTILALVIILLSIMLIGCGTTQKSEFYQLGEATNNSLVGASKGAVIGLGPIQLPEYLNRPQIITRNSEYSLNISEFHRWVEPLKDSISRSMLSNISNNLQSNQVYWIPGQSKQYPIDLRIIIDIGRFDGQLGGVVSLESRWTLLDNNNQTILTRASVIKETVNGQTYESLVIAMSQTLQKLGQEISQVSESYLKN
jgi:uncharacterized protein